MVFASRLYKMASVLMVLFTLAHTYGFLKFKPPSPEGLAVLDSMKKVYFQVKGATFSYGGFYRGFGLAILNVAEPSHLKRWRIPGSAND